MADVRSTRTLRCDCGFVATASVDEELVRLVQTHADEMHGMHLDAALILRLARLGGRRSGRKTEELE